jgi:response regulator RpfG family c-di-GMP phosphodiesterase
MNLALVVDDEPGVRSRLDDKLNSLGLACWSCMDGKAALEKLERETVALILSGLRTRGMSGMELLGNVRMKSPHTQFVMITGKDDTHVGIQAMRQGAADYLVKPLQRASLTASVTRAMERRRLGLQVETYRQGLERMVQERMEQLQSVLNRIEVIRDETLEALGAWLDLHDTETAGHSERVCCYSLEVAKVMGFRREELKELVRGAYLHDIGKIGIPDAILRKPGKLSKEETAVMQTHVAIGYELVSWVPFLAGAAEIILTHHERYDGAGYPQRLEKNKIPLCARIFALADTLDVLTSARSYRQALPFSTARAEIISQSSRQFDPKVVQAFLSIPPGVWNKVRLQPGQGSATLWSRPTLPLNGQLPPPSPRVA